MHQVAAHASARRSDWILQSVKRGKRLPEFEFLVYKDARAAATLRLALAPSSTPS